MLTDVDDHVGAGAPIGADAPPAFRILHVMRTPVGGLFRHVRDLAREQIARGHLVGIVCDSSTADRLTESRLAELAPVLQLGLTRIPMRRDPGPADRAVWHRIADTASTLRIDVLHGHGAKGGAYARLARTLVRKRGGGVAAFYTPHGGALHYKPTHPVGFIYMQLERWLAGATDGLIFESAYAGRMYAERVKPRRPIPTRIVYNGLLPSEFEPVVPASDAAEFLYLGELRDLKGVDVLLAALARITPGRRCRLALFGDGPDRVKLETEARDLGISADVTFHGATPIRSALAMGRCMVAPSRAESLPYVVLETAAAGLPIITTSVGGIPEIVAGSDTSLVPPGEIEPLAAAMRQVLTDPAAATARAGRLRAVVADRFAVAAMTDAILDFYAEALAGR